ncbi:hypothetical protein L227DRAFT_565161 [Lentinus tigrinus ALCF2SS1-6]|uniref:Uncharacterized protein n=1 Tax=Lentinus tigrinus ALCF2SS1-6 TaxID=1328759 RepID=A0A5C2S276_9APHY|nr:hypothetical protein L227DRAFT_565161 [Lentinus tigrinus ALCF2SS1-6]
MTGIGSTPSADVVESWLFTARDEVHPSRSCGCVATSRCGLCSAATAPDTAQGIIYVQDQVGSLRRNVSHDTQQVQPTSPSSHLAYNMQGITLAASHDTCASPFPVQQLDNPIHACSTPSELPLFQVSSRALPLIPPPPPLPPSLAAILPGSAVYGHTLQRPAPDALTLPSASAYVSPYAYPTLTGPVPGSLPFEPPLAMRIDGQEATASHRLAPALSVAPSGWVQDVAPHWSTNQIGQGLHEQAVTHSWIPTSSSPCFPGERRTRSVEENGLMYPDSVDHDDPRWNEDRYYARYDTDCTYNDHNLHGREEWSSEQNMRQYDDGYFHSGELREDYEQPFISQELSHGTNPMASPYDLDTFAQFEQQADLSDLRGQSTRTRDLDIQVQNMATMISDGTSNLAESRPYAQFGGTNTETEIPEDVPHAPDSSAGAFILAQDSVQPMSSITSEAQEGVSVPPVWTHFAATPAYRRLSVVPALRRSQRLALSRRVIKPLLQDAHAKSRRRYKT